MRGVPSSKKMAVKPATAPKPPRASALQSESEKGDWVGLTAWGTHYGAAALAVNPKRCGAGLSLWKNGISKYITEIWTEATYSTLTLAQTWKCMQAVKDGVVSRTLQMT